MKEFDWNEFKRGTFGVKFNSKIEEQDFLKQCEEQDIPWILHHNHNQSVTEVSHWNEDSKNNVYYYYKDAIRIFVCFENCNNKILEWSDYCMNINNENKFKLTDEFKQYGYIHCNSQEEFDDMIKWFGKNSSVCEDIRYDYNKIYTVYLNGYGLHTCAENYNDSLCSFCGSDDRFIIEWTNYMSAEYKTFTKDMLKDGMVVEINEDGMTYLVLNNNLIKTSTYIPLDSYSNSLKHFQYDDLSIKKIYKLINCKHSFIGLLDNNNLELIWERKEEKPLELTMEDIEKQYGCKVKIVNK